jgi:hypothetical protein
MRKALLAAVDFVVDPPRNFVIFTLAVLWFLLLAVAANAQETTRDTARMRVLRDSLSAADSARHATSARVDSLLHEVDSLLTASAPRTAPTIWQLRLHSVGARARATKVYAAGITAGLALNYFGRVDADPGGYRDSWTSPDKFAHFQVAYFLTDVAMGQSVSKRWAFALTCGLAGVGWEVSQRGFISGKDIAADCAGSALAVGLRALREKAR